MSSTYQVMRIGDHSPFSLEEQHRFWKKLYYALLQKQIWWDRSQGTLWVDLLYKGNAPFESYISMSEDIMQKLPGCLIGYGKRKRKRSLSLNPAGREDLKISQGLSVCELKLEFDNLFSLPTNARIELPDSLPLDEGERARISFCLIPEISSEGGDRRSRLLKQKAESGSKQRRSHVDRSGFIRLLLYCLDQLMMKVLKRKAEKSQDRIKPHLSQDTIRKLNDQWFKAYIRIAAPQRHLPKLSRPFESLKGENHLTIHFLPKKEQQACLREMNKQKLGIYSKSDLNPNLLGSREISRLLPLFAVQQSEQEHSLRASPKIL